MSREIKVWTYSITAQATKESQPVHFVINMPTKLKWWEKWRYESHIQACCYVNGYRYAITIQISTRKITPTAPDTWSNEITLHYYYDIDYYIREHKHHIVDALTT